MVDGISTNRNCKDMAQCLVDAGKGFVVRYHSARTQQAQKRLSPQEAAALARAGLQLVTVYQDRARQTADFGRARGVEDGRAAAAYAAQVGQPEGSAIYFAVDTDFSASEIQSFVVPYFEGVRQALQGDGGPRYELGVYGSGLTCRLIKDQHRLARYAWLALAKGWRESRQYQGWDIEQFQPTGPLCGLGQAWEHNVGRGGFGAFTPIGATVVAGQGEALRVTATELFLRRVPTQAGNVPIARLRQGQLVYGLGDAAPPWKRVRATVDGGEVIGYASGKYLQAAATVQEALSPAPAEDAIPAVYFQEGDARAKRTSTGHRAQPIGESPRPSREARTPAEIQAIVDWLAVEASARYQREPSATFCNVYAADFCYLAKAYIPRVWWTGTALIEIGKGTVPKVVYGSTVRELRADDLLAWLIEFGPSFGWRRVFDATALQDAANQGGIGLICADREASGLSGHITVVVPETAQVKAVRDPDAHVVLPVQSQAGAQNFRRSTGNKAWWEDAKFRDRGFFVHD